MGDSYDNAMAESFNGLYKWALIYPQGLWRGLDDVEFDTMTYVDWFNHRRLHGETTDNANYTTPRLRVHPASATATAIRCSRRPAHRESRRAATLRRCAAHRYRGGLSSLSSVLSAALRWVFSGSELLGGRKLRQLRFRLFR